MHNPFDLLLLPFELDFRFKCKGRQHFSNHLGEKWRLTIGMALAAPVLFCWQGMFYGISLLSSSAISDALMTELLIVGGLMITASGLSLLDLKDCKTLNMLPALLVPVAWFIIRAL